MSVLVSFPSDIFTERVWSEVMAVWPRMQFDSLHFFTGDEEMLMTEGLGRENRRKGGHNERFCNLLCSEKFILLLRPNEGENAGWGMRKA